MSAVLQKYYTHIVPLNDYLNNIVSDARLNSDGDVPSYSAMLQSFLIATHDNPPSPTQFFSFEEPEHTHHEVSNLPKIIYAASHLFSYESLS